MSNIDDLIRGKRVVVFSKSYCPYSMRAKDILRSLATDVTVYELDQRHDGPAIQSKIMAQYRHSTVPAVFIKGTFYGGYTDVQGMYDRGELQKLLKK